jgi:hypothetical protein
MEHWFRPMGLSLRVSTNSAKLTAAACEVYGLFGIADAKAEADLQFDFNQSADCLTGALEYRMSSHRAELRMNGQVVLSIDQTRGVACGHFPESFMDDQSSFRLHALQFALSASLPARGFLGVHAACIVINGCAVLLRGPHGVGKSVLTYAATLRGFQVVAGSTVWIAPDDAAWWGTSRWIYLRHSARALFPQMPASPEALIGDEVKVEIDVAQAHIASATPGIIVLLEPNSAEVTRLEATSKAESLPLWNSGMAGNESSAPDYRSRVVRLLNTPSYRLTCSDNIDHALDLIAAVAEDRAGC